MLVLASLNFEGLRAGVLADFVNTALLAFPGNRYQLFALSPLPWQRRLRIIPEPFHFLSCFLF